MGQGFWGAFPRRHRLSLLLWCPRGGLPFWLPVAPAFSLFVCPLSPRPPSRRGRGRPKLFFARGFAPCIPSIRPPAALARPATAFARRGAVSCRACFACRINAFLPPIPPARARRALFPGGEGGDQSYFMQGASPLASPALDRLRHLFALQPHLPGGVLYPAAPALPAVSMLSCPLFPQPPSRREGGDQSYFMQGALPLASRLLTKISGLSF